MIHDLAILALIAGQLLTAAILTRWEWTSRRHDAAPAFDADRWPDLIRSL